VNENFKRFVSSDYGDRYGTGHQYPHGMSALFFSGGAQPWLLILLIVLIYKLVKLSKGQRKDYLSELIFYNKDNKKFISLFFLGFASVVLFWCLAKQLHFYYLLTVIPPFAVWCALLLKRHKIPFKVISSISLFTLFCYFCVLFIIPYVSTKKITRHLFSEMEKLSDTPLGDNSIIFTNFKHPSAYFYGGRKVLICPRETIQASLVRNARFYVVRRKDFEHTPNVDYSSFKVVYQDKGWVILNKL
jgi:hypothetical protein